MGWWGMHGMGGMRWGHQPVSRDGRGKARMLRRCATLLALVALLLTACGRTSLETLDRLQGDSQPGAANLAATVRLLRAHTAEVAAAREHLLLLAAANWYLARLSLDDQLGQMILNEADGTTYSADMAAMVERQHIGGLIIFGDNYGTLDQTRTLFHQVQANAPIPLFIATDQEGGGITRISQYFGAFPSPRELGDTGNPQAAYAAGRRAALDLQELGINTNFAPVVDVPVDGGSPSWGVFRTFSDDPRQVAVFGAAFMAGEQSVGEVTALKHYPGLGAATVDPHKGLPIVTRSLDELHQSELYPYKALIPQMPDMIMSTDVLMPAVDATYPAELSPLWINGILRHEMHYDGVVITDALWMKGIADTWDLGTAAVLALLAGCDILMAAYNSSASQSVLDALKAAIASGRITRARITESVLRILMLKIKYRLLPIPQEVLSQQALMNS